jgi:hypothetical protein
MIMKRVFCGAKKENDMAVVLTYEITTKNSSYFGYISRTG